MARHPFAPKAGRGAGNRNRIYAGLALFVIAVAIVIIYGPFGNNKDKNIEPAPPPDANEGAVFNADENITTDENLDDVGDNAGSDTNVVADNNVTELNVAILPEPLTQVQVEPGPLETVAAPIVEPNPEAAELIAKATALISETPSKIIEARDRLNEVLRIPMSVQQRALVKDQLSELADKWLFSRTVFPGDELCESYQVKSGNQLRIIGDRFKVPYEILVDINKIGRPENLKAGEPIKVINGPFHAKVYRSTFTMDVYLQNTFVRSFRVGLGKAASETPTGLWRVKPGGKLVRPPWYDKIAHRTYHPEDPDYPLGSRWIALEGLTGAARDRTGFAIHGTKEPEQIGTAGSRGCIRMHNGDAILVYNLLAPTFSQVEVAE
jgi:LysM repeat protein